jgi:voltage-gated potassium channel Kch
MQTLGGIIGKMFEKKDVATLQPTESETAELKDHVIIMGFGRVGQTIAQLLSERLIPFVALDVRSDRVQAGKAADLPVYFGDAGSPAVLHHVRAERARCAVITLDTPGANYRAVWAMNKHFPNAKIFVRAHDVEHGLNLEKAGATAGASVVLASSLTCVTSAMCKRERALWNSNGSEGIL